MKRELSGGLIYLIPSVTTKSIPGVSLESVEVFKKLKSSTTISDSISKAGYSLSL